MFYVMSVEKDGAEVIDTADGVVEFLSKSQLLNALEQGVAIEGLRYSKSSKGDIQVKAVPLFVIRIMEFDLGIPFFVQDRYFRLDSSNIRRGILLSYRWLSKA